MLEKYISFIKAHHTLVLLVAGFGTLLFLGNLYINKSYDAAVARNAAAQQVLQEQVTKNAELQKQQDAREQQYQTMLETLTRQNQALVSAVAARNQAVAVQQHTDAGLPGAELAARHEALAGVKGVNYTENGFQVSSPVELQTVQSLETLPVLQANLKDEQSLSANKDQQITGLNGIVTGLNGQVGGLRVQLTDADKACTTKIDEIKKGERKAKRNWFARGLAIGGAVAAYLVLHI